VAEVDIDTVGEAEPEPEGDTVGEPEPVVDTVGDVVTVSLGEGVAELDRERVGVAEPD